MSYNQAKLNDILPAGLVLLSQVLTFLTVLAIIFFTFASILAGAYGGNPLLNLVLFSVLPLAASISATTVSANFAIEQRSWAILRLVLPPLQLFVVAPCLVWLTRTFTS